MNRILEMVAPCTPHRQTVTAWYTRQEYLQLEQALHATIEEMQRRSMETDSLRLEVARLRSRQPPIQKQRPLNTFIDRPQISDENLRKLRHENAELRSENQHLSPLIAKSANQEAALAELREEIQWLKTANLKSFDRQAEIDDLRRRLADRDAELQRVRGGEQQPKPHQLVWVVAE